MNLKVFSLIILASVASAIAQNNQGGTLVTAPIRPFAVQDTFPTAWANEIKGGPFTSTNLAGLSNIPTSRLEIGSLGYAQDTGLFHRLTSTNPVTWSSIDGSNFTNLPSATSFSGTLAISNGGSGATTAGGARTNLGLGAIWLTNTVASNFRTAVGLGASDVVFFNSLTVSGAGIEASGLLLSGSNGILAFEEESAKAQTRTNLGLGATWLTNTNVVNFRTDIGLVGSGFASFNSGSQGNDASGEYASTVGGALNTASGNYSFAAGRKAKATNQGAFVWADSQTNDFSSFSSNTFNVRASGGMSLDLGTNGISFRNPEAAANTRTNLGLGATWLTNSTAPLFWASVPASPTNSGTAGQIAYTNNFLYICISNNTWRRVQLGTW